MRSADLLSQIAEFQQRLQGLLQSMSQSDRSQFLQTLVSGFADRFDLARQEEIDAQRRQIERAQEQIAALEARLARLEADQTKR
ncbi:MAG: accessory factor UbiK family protein [Betaproteobacteria bacterium]|jgi:BMFP domain-containing protein YqiC|nr:accessory factor UbiK family protein [Betaproteobacteria bacterium]